MPIYSTNIESLAGSFRLEIDAPGMANVDLLDIGRISYEFDLTPTQSEGARVTGIPGAMTVRASDKMDNTGSLFESMEEYIGVYSGTTAIEIPKANVNLVWVGRESGSTYRFPFDLYFSDMGIDERGGHVTMKLSPKTSNINIQTWGAERAPLYSLVPLPYYFDTLDYFMDETRCCMAGYLIYDYVGTLDGDLDNTGTIYETARNIGTAGVASPVYGSVNVSFDAFPLLPETALKGNGTPVPTFVWNGITTAGYNGSVLVKDMVRQFAGMEGAIFGSGFSGTFYMNRTINTYNVELTNSEVEELSFVPMPRAYNAVVYEFDKDDAIADGIAMLDANIAFAAWPDANQQQKFKLSTYNPYLIHGAFEGDAVPTYGYTYISNSAPIAANLDIINTYQDALSLTSFRAFAGALGITATNRSAFRIQFDLWGAEKLRPYEVIKFDNTVPLRYQGKHFRPTSLEYDLKADKVLVTAYQIDSFTIPGTNVNVNIGDCESGAMVSMISYNTFTNVFSDEDETMTTNYAYNAFTNVFSDEDANIAAQDTSAFDVTAYSNADGNISNVTGISL